MELYSRPEKRAIYFLRRRLINEGVPERARGRVRGSIIFSPLKRLKQYGRGSVSDRRAAYAVLDAALITVKFSADS